MQKICIDVYLQCKENMDSETIKKVANITVDTTYKFIKDRAKTWVFLLLLHSSINDQNFQTKYPYFYKKSQEQKSVMKNTVSQVLYRWATDIFRLDHKNIIITTIKWEELSEHQLHNLGEAIVNGGKVAAMRVLWHAPLWLIFPYLVAIPGITPSIYIAFQSLGKYNPFQFTFKELDARKEFHNRPSQQSSTDPARFLDQPK